LGGGDELKIQMQNMHTPISRIPSLPAQNGNIYNATGTDIVPAPKKE